jgi:nucleotide-binding universal stress UspA family protein
VLGTIVERPQFIQRLPPSEEEVSLINRLTELNQKTAERCHEQITMQLTMKGIDVETHVEVADHVIGALHNLIDASRADLVLLVAHGETGERRWPYGSVTTSLIAHGNSPLLIIQDLSDQDAQPTPAEQAIGESRGH